MYVLETDPRASHMLGKPPYRLASFLVLKIHFKADLICFIVKFILLILPPGKTKIL